MISSVPKGVVALIGLSAVMSVVLLMHRLLTGDPAVDSVAATPVIVHAAPPVLTQDTGAILLSPRWLSQCAPSHGVPLEEVDWELLVGRLAGRYADAFGDNPPDLNKLNVAKVPSFGWYSLRVGQRHFAMSLDGEILVRSDVYVGDDCGRLQRELAAAEAAQAPAKLLSKKAANVTRKAKTAPSVLAPAAVSISGLGDSGKAAAVDEREVSTRLLALADQITSPKAPAVVEVTSESAAPGAPSADKLREMVSRIPDNWTVTYPSAEEKFKIWVFTDPTCTYCKNLHRQLAELNAAGITVHYLMFPRLVHAGEAYAAQFAALDKQLRNAWCSADRPAAFNLLYSSGSAPDAECPKDENGRTGYPMFQHVQLGEMMGLEGTPYIVMANGKTHTGFNATTGVSDVLRKLQAPVGKQ